MERIQEINPAGVMFTAVHSGNRARIFNMTIRLNMPVEPEILQKAVTDITPLFPAFRYRLVKTKWKAFLEYAPGIPSVKPLNKVPAVPRYISEGNGMPDFCFYYSPDGISLEADHVLSDGTGYLTFLKSVIARYLALKGVDISGCKGEIRLMGDTPSDEEALDGYKRNYKKETPAVNRKKTGKVYNTPDTPVKDGYSTVGFAADSSVLVAESKKRGMSVTELVSAAIIKSLIDADDRPIKENIRIAIAVNMRTRVPCVTLRNFSSNVYIDYCPAGRKNISLDEIADAVRGQLKPQLTTAYCLSFIRKTFGAADNIIVRNIPAFIKYPCFREIQKKTHQKEMTVLYSNMGEVKFPSCIASYITGVDFIGGDPYPYGQTKFLSSASASGRFSFFIGKSGSENRFEKILAQTLGLKRI